MRFQESGVIITDSLYQKEGMSVAIANITTVAIEHESHMLKKILLFLLGLFLVAFGIGIFICGYALYIPSTNSILWMESSSGRQKGLVSTDAAFVQRVHDALLAAISER